MSGAIKQTKRLRRRGAVTVFMAVMLLGLLGMVAFALDYGVLLKTRTDLQRVADSAALAALQDLVPASDGTQDLAATAAAVRTYATANTDASFQILDSDIEIGRYDPSTIYSQVTLLNDGIFDTVRVTVRRDAQANLPVSLFFAPVLGLQESGVAATATAVLQRVTTLKPGDAILPISLPQDVWEAQNPGDVWTVYGDGKISDSTGGEIPGNWGTVDVGSTNNSTSDMNDQITNGLDQSHLDFLYADGRLPTNSHIDTAQPLWLNADTGISSGVKSSIQGVHGQTRLMPIYDYLGGDPTGNNLEFHIVGWGVVIVDDSSWKGNKNTWVRVEKAYTYDGYLTPQSDLSNTTGTVTGAFTSPALVE